MKLSRAQRRKLRYGPGGTVRYRDKDGKIGITSYARAKEYELEGRAGFDADGILVFFPENHRCIAAAKRRPRLINGDGFASLEAIAGLPCVQPIRLLFGKRPAVPPKDYPEVVEISRRLLA
jgi:hypothetical protein